MNKLWDDLKDNMKEWGASAVEKAEEISRVAVAKGVEFKRRAYREVLTDLLPFYNKHLKID